MDNNPEFNIGTIKGVECAQEGWALIKDDYWLMFGISIVGALIGGFSFYVLIGAMICGIFYCYLKKIDGRAVAFDDLWIGFKFFGPSLLLTLAVVVPMVAFIMLMFITLYLPLITAAVMGNKGGGGVILGTFVIGFVIDIVLALAMICVHSLLIFAFPLLVDKGISSWDAMKLSARAVRKNLGGVAGLILVNFGLALLGELACGIGLYLVIPIITATNVVAYRKIFPSTGGCNFGPPPPSAYGGI
jgi:hypothetical protein